MNRLLMAWAMLAAAGTVSAAPSYPMLTGSTLQFQGTQQGEKFSGTFKQFDAHVTYDAADLAGSSIDASMQIKSIDTRNTERDMAIVTGDWFDASHYPAATFKTVGFRATPQGVVADADLTIKGRTKRIVFPFALQRTATGATLDAKVTVDRLDFALGAGEWADDSMVGRRVDVVVHLMLGNPAAVPAKPTKTSPAKKTR